MSHIICFTEWLCADTGEHKALKNVIRVALALSFVIVGSISDINF